MNIHIIPILNDNYAYLLEADNGEAAVVDPGEAQPVMRALEDRGLTLTYILTTHHHADHTGGNAELKNSYGAKIVGPEAEAARIGALDIPLQDNDRFLFGGEEAHILETPGHTAGPACFYFPDSGAVFTGDTLFAMGCGRLFEGTAEQMWKSLQRLMDLPDETKIYCGHEYTQANGEFCLSVEPDNPDLQARMTEVRKRRKAGQPTMPSTVALEKQTNVFVRAGSAERFAELRTLKDQG